jgi:hypothetical protein
MTSRLLFLLLLGTACQQKPQAQKTAETAADSRNTSTGKETTPALFDPADTRVVIAGVLTWQDPSLSPFSDRNRKDLELHKLLGSIGVSDSSNRVILDNKATLNRMKNAVTRQMKACGTSSTFIFYYAGHGVKTSKGYFFCNYDMADAEFTWFRVDFLADLAAQHFKGKRIILLADCCYSGSLLEAGKAIREKTGKEVVVLSSATSSNISTGNWTYTQTLLDCLGGDPYADHNSDGRISLEELKTEIATAMRYREHQLNGAAFYGVDPTSTTVSKVNGSRPATAAGPFRPGDYANAYSAGKWKIARIKGVSDNGALCEFYDYADKSSATLPVEKLQRISEITYNVGQKVKADWKGTWYEATIQKVENGFMYIHYDGYDGSDDEWLMYDRLKTGNEEKVQVEWGGDWYDGWLLGEKDGKFFITYQGYPHTWDEWVEADRIRR